MFWQHFIALPNRKLAPYNNLSFDLASQKLVVQFLSHTSLRTASHHIVNVI